MAKWKCIEPCDGGCILSTPHDENSVEGWTADTLKGQLCLCSKWEKVEESEVLSEIQT